VRGKRAKKLREAATVLLEGDGTKMSEGYREYNQAMNRAQMVAALDENDQPIIVGGQPTLKPELLPGTITCAWVFRNTYKLLKKGWKRRFRNDFK